MEKLESRAIARCQHGQLDEFSVLYDLYFHKIYSFVFYKTFHKETTEDITSKTFLKALDNIKKFDQSKGAFSSWLYVIAKRTIIDHYRTTKDSYDIFDCWDISSKDDVFENVANKEQLENIKKYLKNLNPEKRNLVIMRIWQELSYEEISCITGKSQASLKMMFSRVMGKIRNNTLVALFIISETLNINF